MKKDIGLGIKPPKNKCKDINCPWHGKLSIRGRVFDGKVESVKAHKTVSVRIDYVKYIPKYERYERRKSIIKAHVPTCFSLNDGDNIKIAECRKISKTKAFVVVGKRGDNY